jgi:hypothetical protein
VNKRTVVLILIIISILTVALANSIVRVYNLVSYKYLMRVLPVIGIIFLILGVILFVLKKVKYIMIISAFFILALYISDIISVMFINNQRQNIFNDGTLIAGAIERYYEDNNKYPKDLDELIPKYIDSIPKIKTTYDEGDFTYYITEGGKSYFLGFENYYYDGIGWIEAE